MLKRKAYAKMMEWKENPKKKALCIFGARQIGKTTLIRLFAQEQYKNFVEFNFIADDKTRSIFSGSLDAETIITNMTAYARKPMEPGKTLILFDEVQECPQVRTAIKFLVEDGRFDYVESGSLLGVKVKDIKSYPVGFEEIYQMYPMDFEEYLWANGVQDSTIAYMKKCFVEHLPVTAAVDTAMKDLFRSSIIVGGMPQVVQTYVETHDIGKVIEAQRDILAQYRLDISKYAAGAEKIRIQAIFDSLPSQLNDKNRRFYITQLNKDARMNRYDSSFKWLEDAGVALPCYNAGEPQPPLALNAKHNLFKLYVGDTGLLCAACMDNIQLDILNGNLDVNMGSVLENMIAQQLKSSGYQLYYFDSKKHGEVDFAIQDGMSIDLVEVKSGKDYHRHAAINNVLNVSEWKFKHAYVLSQGNMETGGQIEYLPWYMIIFLRPEPLPKNMQYKVDISALNQQEC